MGRRIVYLAVQSVEEGQAGYTHVNEIVAALRDRGWRVSLFFSPPREARRPLELALRTLWVQFRAAVSVVGADVVYIRNHPAAFPLAMWARILRTPVVQEVNGPYDDFVIAWPQLRKVLPLIRSSVRVQLRWAEVVVTVTDGLRDWASREAGHARAVVVPNAANTEVFRPGLPTPDRLPAPYVVFFGALTPWQGLRTIIAATDDPRWPDDTHLVIVGDGEEGEAVRQAARRAPHRISYLGTKPYDEVPQIVGGAVASLALATGRSGSGISPLKVYESLACGVPVVASDDPEVAELLGERCGITVPTDDPAAVAGAVRRLRDGPDEARQMGLAGRRLVEHDHSWSARAETLDRLLDEIGGAR